MARSDYNERKEARIERYIDLFESNTTKSNELSKKASDMASVIPFGQPILVGHHSETRDRNYRNRIHNTMGKAVEASDKADYYKHRAEVAQNNNAISSDDPEAITKLKEKIAALEANQELMIKANKLIKKNDREGLKALGLTEKQVEELFKPDFCGRIGFPSFATQNNRANITRCKERLERLEKELSEGTTEKELENGIRIVDSIEENRLQIFFPGKPDEAIREQLKSHGFKWSGKNGCWQRFRSNDANYWAKKIVEGIK